MTAKDLRDLDVIAETADMIGYSFVQRPSDIELLQGELAKRFERPDLVPLIAKIETKLAIRNLPELIVQAAGRQPLAVMIARGDLAVELGYRRLAELQEELLWLCEAAHVPIIWATQVLDGLVRKGIGARAEVTDAAMSERAECVMLNKGPFVIEAVKLLDDLLGRWRAPVQEGLPNAGASLLVRRQLLQSFELEAKQLDDAAAGDRLLEHRQRLPVMAQLDLGIF